MEFLDNNSQSKYSAMLRGMWDDVPQDCPLCDELIWPGWAVVLWPKIVLQEDVFRERYLYHAWCYDEFWQWMAELGHTLPDVNRVTLYKEQRKKKGMV